MSISEAEHTLEELDAMNECSDCGCDCTCADDGECSVEGAGCDCECQP